MKKRCYFLFLHSLSFNTQGSSKLVTCEEAFDSFVGFNIEVLRALGGALASLPLFFLYQSLKIS